MSAAEPRRGSRWIDTGGLASALSLALSLVVGCASRSPSALAPAGAMPVAESAPAADEGGAGGLDYDGASVEEEKREASADAELDLASYERLLVERELQLRSAGVAIASISEERDREFNTKGDARPGKSGGGSADGVVGGVVGTTTRPSTSQTKSPTSKPAPTPARPSDARKSKSKSSKRADAPGREPMADEDGDSCLMICELAAATCDLEQRICELAARHPGESRYQQVCARAGEDCRLATQACEACAV